MTENSIELVNGISKKEIALSFFALIDVFVKELFF